MKVAAFPSLVSHIRKEKLPVSLAVWLGLGERSQGNGSPLWCWQIPETLCASWFSVVVPTQLVFLLEIGLLEFEFLNI